MTGEWPEWLSYGPPLLLIGMFVWFLATWDPAAPRRPQTRAQHVRQSLFWVLMTTTWAVLGADKWRDPDANLVWIALYAVAIGAGALEALRWLLKARRIPAEGGAEPSSSPPRT